VSDAVPGVNPADVVAAFDVWGHSLRHMIAELMRSYALSQFERKAAFTFFEQTEISEFMRLCQDKPLLSHSSSKSGLFPAFSIPISVSLR
jgi:hypothetical protein